MTKKELIEVVGDALFAPKLQIFDTVVEYTEMVEELLSQRPDARKKVIYKEWLSEINYYADKANKLAKYPIYGKFK